MTEERGHCWSLGAVGWGWGAGILGQEHRGPRGQGTWLRAGKGLMWRQSPGGKLSQAVHLLREGGGENKG